MDLILQVLIALLWIYVLVLFARVVFDWVRVFARDWRPAGVMLVVVSGIYALTDPPLRAIRRALPEVNLGRVRLDLSFIVLLIACYIAIAVLGAALS